MSSLLPRILLVDDEPEVLEILNEYLAEQGFAVRTAMEGNEALVEAKRWTPKAVLLDVMMPNIGGLEILERMRQINPGIVAILMSGQSSAIEVLATAGLRVAGTFPKPLNLPEVLATLEQAGVVPSRIQNGDDDGPARPRGDIMVVDDVADVREVLAEYLELKGFDVRQASSGEEGLEKVAESRPDVVLLDLGLPGLSGIETLRRLKSDNPALCVIVVSGNQDQDLAQKALAMGAADYVPKPVDFGYLQTILAIHGHEDQITAR
ncbi:MAG TPA: response regulator [Terriglobales bacterium]|nr:response regulator [Terriglobales bacterium]